MPVKMKKPKFKRTKRVLHAYKNLQFEKLMRTAGKQGVAALSKATPIDTSETANSWDYAVIHRGETIRLVFTNSVMAGRTPLVILLQYGHATRDGGYVLGQDFINPALDGVFSDLKRNLTLEVLKHG